MIYNNYNIYYTSMDLYTIIKRIKINILFNNYIILFFCKSEKSVQNQFSLWCWREMREQVIISASGIHYIYIIMYNIYIIYIYI